MAASEGRGYELERSLRREHGRSEEGSFVGRGPKGWQRSDDRIREEVCEALADDPDVDASEVEVKVESGEVTLEGTVKDREQKRLIEEIADGQRGVRDVQNRIRVESGAQAAASSNQEGSGRGSNRTSVYGQASTSTQPSTQSPTRS